MLFFFKMAFPLTFSSRWLQEDKAMIFFLPLISSTQQSARHIVDAQCIFSNENIDVSSFPNYKNSHPVLQTSYFFIIWKLCVCVFSQEVYALNETLSVLFFCLSCSHSHPTSPFHQRPVLIVPFVYLLLGLLRYAATFLHLPIGTLGTLVWLIS